MGTRHNIRISINGTTKVAQYGQWDGYIGKVGLNLVSIIGSILESDKLEEFTKKVSNLRFFSKEELEDLDKRADHIPQMYLGSKDTSRSFYDEYPQLSRDTSYNIINLIQEGKIDKVVDWTSDWALDVDFRQCEYLYHVEITTDEDEEYDIMLKGYDRKMNLILLLNMEAILVFHDHLKGM